MIDIRTAVNAANRYLTSLQDVMGNSLQDVRLEEVELSDDHKFWLVTLGFDTVAKNRTALDMQLRGPQRDYKLFRVNAETGEVEAMKIRKV